MKLTMEEQVKQLTVALNKAQKEAEKWQTGAEIYESQATELQETMQLMAQEIEKLRRENEALRQNQDQGQRVVPVKQQKTVSDQELIHYRIIEDALISKIQQLEQQLRK